MYFNRETFYVNTGDNRELEMEITDKLETEFNKKHPNICREFIPKLLEE